MKYSAVILSIAAFILQLGTSCGSRNSNPLRSGYQDGTYCAQVEYYYSETGTNSSYTLLVEVEDNELVKIYWPNGGWLDNSHFTAPDVEDGSASFTSDRGVDYEITIIGHQDDCSTSWNATDEDDLIQEQEEQEHEEQQLRDDEEREEEEERKRREDDDLSSEDDN